MALTPEEEEAILGRIELLQLVIPAAFQHLASNLVSTWIEYLESFNAGQTSIYYDYLELALYDWLTDAADDWPWVDAGDYVDAMYNGYDFEVAERAFSEAIETPVPMMQEVISVSQGLSVTLDFLEGLL